MIQQGNRGPFCSRLVLSVFASHLEKMENSSDDQRLNFSATHGALGLSAAAVRPQLFLLLSFLNTYRFSFRLL